LTSQQQLAAEKIWPAAERITNNDYIHQPFTFPSSIASSPKHKVLIMTG
jgi:hypothetical protein